MGVIPKVCRKCGCSFGGAQPCECPNAKPTYLRACPNCGVHSIDPHNCECRAPYNQLPRLPIGKQDA